MLYLWKVFIEDEGIPSIFFNHFLKQLLVTQSQKLGIEITSNSDSDSGAITIPSLNLNSLNSHILENDNFMKTVCRLLPFYPINKWLLFQQMAAQFILLMVKSKVKRIGFY